MKSIALLAAATMVFSSLAWAQAQKPAAPEAAKPAALEAAKPAAPEAKPAVAAAKPSAPMSASRRARRAEDARHCLERPTNTEVIKCSEAYL